MLNGKRNGFAAAEAICASFAAALLLAAGVAMLVSGARIASQYEQMLALERAKRETRMTLRASEDQGQQGAVTSGGFRVSLLQQMEHCGQWRISKPGAHSEIEGTVFVPR